MAAAFGNPVIVSGGIATAADIRALAPIADAVEGVITGRAIYEGTLTVADGVAACDGTFQLSDQLEEEEPSPDHRRAGKLANKEEQPGRRRVP